MEYIKYVVFCHVGFCGMDGVYPMVMPADATEDEIAQEAYELAVTHAEGYGYYPMYDGEYEDDADVEDCYVDSIEGYAVVYNPTKHDGQRAGGGSFENDFKRMIN